MSKAEKEILADKNFGVRLCATIDRIFQESGMKQMAINGSTGNYREIEMSFFKAIGSLNAVCESEPQSPAPTKEGLEERAEKWADKISGTSDQWRIGLVSMKEKWVHDWVKEAYIAGAQSSLQPSSPDPTVDESELWREVVKVVEDGQFLSTKYKEVVDNLKSKYRITHK